MNQEINNGAVRVLREYTGRGPTKARSVVDRDTRDDPAAPTRSRRASAASPRAARLTMSWRLSTSFSG